MRKALKYFIESSVSLYLVSLLATGLVFEKGLTTVMIAGVALSVATLIIKPVINILLLPLNLITFGLFRWVGYAVALYIVTLVVPGFKVLDFAFKGFSTYWLVIPPVTLHGLLALVIFSFVISITSSLLDWLLK